MLSAGVSPPPGPPLESCVSPQDPAAVRPLAPGPAYRTLRNPEKVEFRPLLVDQDEQFFRFPDFRDPRLAAPRSPHGVAEYPTSLYYY